MLMNRYQPASAAENSPTLPDERTPCDPSRVDAVTADPVASFARPVVAAGVLFFDDKDRVLLVVPSYKNYRDIPGGYVEHGETPSEAAAREVREELGISPPIGRLLLTDSLSVRLL